MDNWKTIEPNVWKPKDIGDHIMGIVVNKTPKDESTGLSAKYQIENQDGMFLVWGSTVLDDRFQYVPVGSKVGISTGSHDKQISPGAAFNTAFNKHLPCFNRLFNSLSCNLNEEPIKNCWHCV